jgi:hypothetical protein
MADYCSDCSNLDCSCFKKFVQNVSKRNVPSTSARITLLNDLYNLVGTMQYNIFSDAFIEEIKKSLERESLYIDCSNIKLTDLEAKILLRKDLIIKNFTPSDANSSSSSDASKLNYEKFMNRIYNQLERTTFLYGKPNNNILYYEEKFYSLFRSEESRNSTKHSGLDIIFFDLNFCILRIVNVTSGNIKELCCCRNTLKFGQGIYQLELFVHFNFACIIILFLLSLVDRKRSIRLDKV